MTRAALGFLLLASACGGRDAPPRSVVVSDTDGLTRCFAAAYAEADPDAAIARCEATHFGTEWRREISAGSSDPATSRTGPGNLEPRLVQAGVRAREGRMRACYRAGVQRDPTLRGEVHVRFVIGLTGHVVRVEDAGSRLRDKQVTACVHREFSALRFPRPEGGTVTSAFPLVFGAGDTYR